VVWSQNARDRWKEDELTGSDASSFEGKRKCKSPDSIENCQTEIGMNFREQSFLTIVSISAMQN
jgi:hypothetical protein